MRWYRQLPHTSDALIEAYGRTLEEAFSNAARAMTSILVDIRRVSGRLSDSCSVDGVDLEALLYNWLECVLNRFEVEGEVLSRFKVKISRAEAPSGSYVLEAAMAGERYDPKRHGAGREVKAVTYHDMSIEYLGGLYVIRFLLDL